MSRPRATLLYATCALALFAALAWFAVSTKSATFDEPEHVAASYVALRHGDFAVEPDHPPLWKYWAALPLLVVDPPVTDNTDTPVFRDIPAHVTSAFAWSVATVYQTPGNDPGRMIALPRFMMLLVGVGLGAVTALFAYRAAGAVAGCVAVTLFALDPNFLAHAPLVKNDVAIALLTTALTYTLYRAGQSLTPLRLVSIALLCAACVTTKLTGLFAGPLVVLALGARALLSAPWPVLRRTLATRAQRLLAAVAVCVACAAVTYVAIWAVYLFRFDPSPDPAVHYDTAQFLSLTADRGPSLRAALFALDHHLLPEAFLEGFVYARAHAADRPAYALGHLYAGGRWYYFPLAFVVKTPLSTLAALAGIPLVVVVARRWGARDVVAEAATPREGPGGAWVWVCVLAPVVVFLGPSVLSSVNIGIRHIFPVLPPMYVAAGVLAARAYAMRPRVARPAMLVLALALLVETTAAYPNYIPFFNVAAGGYRGGFYLLGDSNLDWGQDLPLLAAWQRAHPDRPLHLAYFGLADPAAYGIRYIPAPHTYPSFLPNPPTTLPTTGVLAVSASILQGVSDPLATDHPYAPFLHRTPAEILGGSIYLYDLDAP